DNIREAEKLMSFITQKLNKYGLKIDLTNVELKLVDRNHLANLAHSRTKDFSGFTKFIGKKTQYETVSTKFEIFILHGMPKDRFRATMAHELMHVWLYSYAPMDMDPALTEGSCNYASYLLLQNDRSKEVAYILSSMEKDPDIFYGDGYRRVKKLVRRLGIEVWLEYLEDNKNFQSGY
ncbi:MAG: protein DA1, partial [candidate division Zixibacteria bacterium]|nr:protein DA1 [candidate division Zixibacteria bacterium]